MFLPFTELKQLHRVVNCCTPQQKQGLSNAKIVFVMADQQRPPSPPPTYEEAINDGRPPPPYAENEAQESTHTPRSEHHTPTQRHSRVSPIISSPDSVIVLNQPGRRNERLGAHSHRSRERQGDGATQPRKKLVRCNCLCSAFQWTPCTCDCEIFCFNCLAFLSYLLLCAPGVYLCWGCKKMCPETCGDCYARKTSLVDLYEEREDSIPARVCWFCIGPCCCFTCDGDGEVCPCTDPCVKRCGICSVFKKMTCYCGSYNVCDYNLNVMDEQAVGFICDCKEVGCSCS